MCAQEQCFEWFRWKPPLGTVEPQADDGLSASEDRIEGRLGRGRAEISKQTRDEPGGDAQFALRAAQGGSYAVHHIIKRNAAPRVRLRIEKYLDVAEIGRA